MRLKFSLKNFEFNKLSRIIMCIPNDLAQIKDLKQHLIKILSIKNKDFNL